jgi:voltage-gated potassium channel
MLWREARATIRSIPANVARAGVLLVLITVAGTAGYIIIEGWSFLDALYMTVIVLTTIGFHEVRPLDDSGRMFTMLLAVTGVGAILYALLAVFQFIIEGELGSILGRQRMKARIDAMNQHYILCGFGRVGEEVAREFVARKTPFVVIETTQEAIERAQKRGYLLLIGDATNDDILKEAGVERARCVLAASDSDSGNTFIVLTAKALNPGIFVVARAAHPESRSRMHRAGADRVFSPYIIAGRQMAISAVQPDLVEFIDTLSAGIDGAPIIAEIDVSPESGLAGHTITAVLSRHDAVTLLAVRHRAGQISVGPAGDTILEIGDRVIVTGAEEELNQIQTVSRA